MRVWVLFLLLLAAVSFVSIGSAGERSGFWYYAADTDTLAPQESHSSIWKVDGCTNVTVHYAGAKSDSVTLTLAGSNDGVNFTSIALTSLANLNWATYSRISRTIQATNQAGVTLAEGVPAKYLRLTIKCDEDTTGGNGDPDSLITWSYGITCGGAWSN